MSNADSVHAKPKETSEVLDPGNTSKINKCEPQLTKIDNSNEPIDIVDLDPKFIEIESSVNEVVVSSDFCEEGEPNQDDLIIENCDLEIEAETIEESKECFKDDMEEENIKPEDLKYLLESLPNVTETEEGICNDDARIEGENCDKDEVEECHEGLDEVQLGCEDQIIEDVGVECSGNNANDFEDKENTSYIEDPERDVNTEVSDNIEDIQEPGVNECIEESEINENIEQSDNINTVDEGEHNGHIEKEVINDQKEIEDSENIVGEMHDTQCDMLVDDTTCGDLDEETEKIEEVDPDQQISGTDKNECDRIPDNDVRKCQDKDANDIINKAEGVVTANDEEMHTGQQPSPNDLTIHEDEQDDSISLKEVDTVESACDGREADVIREAETVEGGQG